MTTHELNKDQMEQLKSNLFYNEEEWSDALTKEDIDTIENSTSWNEIPDEIVHKNYAGVEFVPDDFSQEEKVEYPAITTVEDLCHTFSQPLNQHEVVQARLERVLEYLYENYIIDNYRADMLDYLVSDEQCY
jgi:hypothetical protein